MFKIIISITIIFISNILANPQTAKFGSKIFYKCDYDKDGFLNQKEYLRATCRFTKKLII